MVELLIQFKRLLAPLPAGMFIFEINLPQGGIGYRPGNVIGGIYERGTEKGGITGKDRRGKDKGEIKV
jgi:hypothetical protein